ncbi:torsin-2A-like isoform X3 [Styela clava]
MRSQIIRRVLLLSAFKRDLENKLHGQHLVVPTVYKAVTDHVSNPNPSKPLVLSFHGWTGGGKSFVSRMIANNLFKKGEHSPYFHHFNSIIHFRHKDMTGVCKDQLHSWIYHNVSNCARSVFIFDEMDHIPEGIMDVLAPFLGHSVHVDRVDFRKTIFIFLRNLIDHFVPFLPLERSHVRNCIIDEMKRRNLNEGENFIQEVLKELLWFPEVEQLYSTSGCKKIAHKLALAKDEL